MIFTWDIIDKDFIFAPLSPAKFSNVRENEVHTIKGIS